MMTTYREQLQHPLWQRKRLEVLEHFDFECCACGSNNKMLNVHHKRCRKDRPVWDYPLEMFEALCVDCHKVVHEHRDQIDELVAAFPSSAYPILVGVLKRLHFLRAVGIDAACFRNIVQDEIDVALDFRRGGSFA